MGKNFGWHKLRSYTEILLSALLAQILHQRQKSDLLLSDKLQILISRCDDEYFRNAIRIRMKLPDKLAIANSLNALADVLAEPKYSKYNLVEAARVYQGAINIVLPHTDVHAFLASSKIGKAYVMSRQGKYAESELLYLKAIIILEVLFGKQHHELAQPKAALGALYLHCGNYEKGLSFYENAIQLLEETFGDNHPAITLYKDDLAKFYIFL